MAMLSKCLLHVYASIHRSVLLSTLVRETFFCRAVANTGTCNWLVLRTSDHEDMTNTKGRSESAPRAERLGFSYRGSPARGSQQHLYLPPTQELVKN